MSKIVKTKRKRLRFSWVLLVQLDCGHIIMTRTEMAVCELCERAFCLSCLPTHEPCVSQLLAEERVLCPERAKA